MSYNGNREDTTPVVRAFLGGLGCLRFFFYILVIWFIITVIF